MCEEAKGEINPKNRKVWDKAKHHSKPEVLPTDNKAGQSTRLLGLVLANAAGDGAVFAEPS